MSAARGFFDAISFGDRKFVDGALGVDNPVEEAEAEASDIWCAEIGPVQPLDASSRTGPASFEQAYTEVSRKLYNSKNARRRDAAGVYTTVT
ncbi:hypothetical protein EDD36DRAFT_423999 [Exophiala viscosa]|uniref:PNPLA domain-containing protein n=1 Tax=Exophiala viscosa TaxID=2486360 RepID=A0AAN6E3D3_9EURO|nr:hypothetical protein EDD36DRAFT_423999 [Exophiala viscosa]